MTDKNLEIVVIGAGPAGMTAGYCLAKAGYKPKVYEAAPSVGGMAKTIELWGQKVDLGPHRFFSNERIINELWLEVVGSDYSMVNRLTRIFYKDKFFYYPLRPANALLNLGLFEAARCVFSYLSALFPWKKSGADFESWVSKRFGNRLFEIFFKSYSEKLWGISCRDLDADFAAQRIKKLSLFGAVWNALVKPRQSKHKTLVDQFAYPHGGTGEVYERMAAFIRMKGGTVATSTPVKKIVCEKNQVTGIELNDGTYVQCDEVISTMPISLLLKNLDDVPGQVQKAAAKLTFRNTILVYLEVDGLNLFQDNWLYVHSPEIRCGRVTNFRNWVPQICQGSDNTILCLEYWCYDDDSIWTESDDKLIALATEELKKTGLHKGKAILRGHTHRVPKCYPVYATGYQESLGVVVEYLKAIDRLQLIGRYGSFKYNNQDHSILMGIYAAENLHSNKQHDLWAINTDDDYQEEASISEVGIQIEKCMNSSGQPLPSPQ